MKKRPQLAVLIILVVVASSVAGALFAQDAADSAAPPLSKIAPVKDLTPKKDYFMGRLEEALASEDDYSESMQIRVLRDAAAMSVILQGFALTDEDNPLKEAAAGLREHALKLIKSNEDYAAAKAELDALKAGLESPTASDAKTSWDDEHPSLELLMKQVSTSNTGARRYIRANRFDDNMETIAENTALVALIAQSIISDTHHVENEADTAQWKEFASKFRDLAGEVNAAVAAKDQPTAEAKYKELTQTCTDCHDKFKKDEE